MQFRHTAAAFEIGLVVGMDLRVGPIWRFLHARGLVDGLLPLIRGVA